MRFTIISKTHGKFEILYDSADDHHVQGHTWSIIKKGNGKFYVVTEVRDAGKRKTKYLHQFIMNAPKGMCTDHINGDPLDNRRQNLRVCTQSENAQNRGKQKNNTSGYKGVFANGKRWMARIRLDGKDKYLGNFKTRAEAGRVRDRATVKYFSLVTPQMLNFPFEYDFEEKKFRDNSDEFACLMDRLNVISKQIIFDLNKRIAAEMHMNRET